MSPRESVQLGQNLTNDEEAVHNLVAKQYSSSFDSYSRCFIPQPFQLANN